MHPRPEDSNTGYDVVSLNTAGRSKYSVAVCVAMVDMVFLNATVQKFEVYSGSSNCGPDKFKVYCNDTTHAGDVRVSYFKKMEDDSDF
jgi:hypothetical protein